MSHYSMKAMPIVIAAGFALAGCAAAGSSAYIFCENSGQPIGKCKTVTSGMKCLPQNGGAGGSLIKCK